MNLASLTQAVADQVALVDGVSATFNYPVRSAQPVFATVVPQEFPPRLVYTGNPRVPLTVRVVVGQVDDRTAAGLLYDFMSDTGSRSVMARLEAIDHDTIDSLAVIAIGEPQVFEYGSLFLLGVDFTVDVIAS